MGQRHHRIRHAVSPIHISIVSRRRGDGALGGKRTLLAIWLIFPCSFTDTLHPSLEESCAVGWSEERAGWRRVHGRPSKTREKLVRQDRQLDDDEGRRLFNAVAAAAGCGCRRGGEYHRIEGIKTHKIDVLERHPSDAQSSCYLRNDCPATWMATRPYGHVGVRSMKLGQVLCMLVNIDTGNRQYNTMPSYIP